jgi:acyl-CoA synthetase (AMP-forming)/AMP-acid ligase II
MLTGDEASMDAEGYVSITGRIKDLIIRGGENIHPSEIENCLLSHEGVREASVVGLPDERYGEVVAAFVVRNQTPGVQAISATQVREYVRERLSGHLGEYKYPLPTLRDGLGFDEVADLACVVPKYVFWVTDYPKTASGKIQKFKLQEDGVRLCREGQGLE